MEMVIGKKIARCPSNGVMKTAAIALRPASALPSSASGLAQAFIVRDRQSGRGPGFPLQVGGFRFPYDRMRGAGQGRKSAHAPKASWMARADPWR